MTYPGFVPPQSGDTATELAKIWAAIRAMQKEPAPISNTTTDTKIYGDVISTGPRKLAAPTAVGTVSVANQLYSTFIGTLSTDTVFTVPKIYTHVANGASGVVGLYTGTSTTLTLQASTTLAVADGTVNANAFPSPVTVLRNNFVALVINISVSTSQPTFAAFSPSGTNMPNFTGSGLGVASARFNTTGIALPSSMSFTTGWTSLPYTFWAALS